jgi:hypothetical protein
LEALGIVGDLNPGAGVARQIDLGNRLQWGQTEAFSGRRGAGGR